ncbi:MAG: LamG domain-containing protein [Patescibacteria group bacterium]|nr:LamG domain-containing protein [Patescibacteria group bacterium]
MLCAVTRSVGRFPRVALVLTSLLVAASPARASVIYDALAFWEFSSDFSDLTGNYHGTGKSTYTTGGPVIQAAPAGYSGSSALYLRGIGAAITPPADNPTHDRQADYIDFGGMSLSGAFAISAWIRPEATNAVLLGDAANLHWLRVTNATTAVLKNVGTTTLTLPASTFTAGQWHHFVLTRDDANGITIYHDTDQVATGTRAGVFSPEYLGVKFENTSVFKGYMAEVGVWDKVLTSEQIGQLYVRGADPTANALAFWTFDSNFANSGTGGATHHGYAMTQSTPFAVTNALGDSVVGGGALKLRGTTAKDYVRIGDDGSGNPLGMTLSGPMTIAAWLNPTSLGTAATFLGGTNDDWIRLETGGKITVRFGGSGNNWNTTLSEGFEAGEWQHFMLTRDTDGNLSIYRNLELVASRSNYAHTFSPLYLGMKAPEATVNYYQGLMDDFGIWDRVLSPLEMQALYLRIPEPGSMILLLCGVMVSLLRRRRHR